MKQRTQATLQHAETWELLPWLVNGRLGEAHRMRLEAHLRECSACREEASVQRRICEAIAAESVIEQIPAASLNKLRRRIDQLDADIPELSMAHDEALQPLHGAFTARLRALSIAATVLVAAVLLGIPAAHYWQHSTREGAGASYYTVSSPAPKSPRAVIRAVFTRTLTLAELQGVLDDAKLSIASGPTEAGVYSLSMNGSESTAWALQRLRAYDSVRFAEAITPEPAAPP